MSLLNTRWWERLETWRGTAFLIGGTVFVADTAVLVSHAMSGTEPAAFGQAFVGAAWTAAFLGLLGLYPALSERAPRLTAVGAVSAVVGGLTNAAMAVTSLGYWSGLLSGGLEDVVFYFLPGVFLGIVVGVGSFTVVALRGGSETRRLGLLFLLLPLTFLFNLGTGMAGFNPVEKIVGVVVVLALTMLGIGYLLRSGAIQPRGRQAEATATG